MARTNLDVKRFNEYTKDEQMEIMFHWWHYYGKLPLSFAEMDKFKNLMEEDMEFVKNAALIAWARESASQDLVRAMRADLEGYKKHVKELAGSKEFKDVEQQRKAVKEQVLAPYMQFEEVYKQYISDKYKSADIDLKNKTFLITRKGGKQTILHMGQQLHDKFVDYFALHDWTPTTPLFTKCGHRLSVRAVENIVKK